MVVGRKGVGVVPGKRCTFCVAGRMCPGKGAGKLLGWSATGAADWGASTVWKVRKTTKKKGRGEAELELEVVVVVR